MSSETKDKSPKQNPVFDPWSGYEPPKGQGAFSPTGQRIFHGSVPKSNQNAIPASGAWVAPASFRTPSPPSFQLRSDHKEAKDCTIEWIPLRADQVSQWWGVFRRTVTSSAMEQQITGMWIDEVRYASAMTDLIDSKGRDYLQMKIFSALGNIICKHVALSREIAVSVRKVHGMLAGTGD